MLSKNHKALNDWVLETVMETRVPQLNWEKILRIDHFPFRIMKTEQLVYVIPNTDALMLGITTKHIYVHGYSVYKIPYTKINAISLRDDLFCFSYDTGEGEKFKVGKEIAEFLGRLLPLLPHLGFYEGFPKMLRYEGNLSRIYEVL